MKKFAVFGGGKMAFEIAVATSDSADVRLSALVSRNRPDWLQETEYFSSLDQLSALPDLLIDFTLSGGTCEAANWCRARLVPLVSGTTALSEKDRSALMEAAELVPVMWAPNLSKGLNLLMKSVVEVAKALPGDTPVEILDVHHAHKIDAPSGTALLLARAIASARNQDLEEYLNVVTGEGNRQYKPGSINCISRRQGEIIGEHRVRFLAGSEELEYRHSAGDRNVYAQGCLDAAMWLVRQPAGLYSSSDWLSV